MERKKLICIGCPKGCELTVFLDGKQVTKVEGNHCKKGAVYGEKEVTAPTRIVTSTVTVLEGEIPVVPVKTASDIPKDKILACVQALKNVKVTAPVEIGDVIVHDIVHTGVAVVATKKIRVNATKKYLYKSCKYVRVTRYEIQPSFRVWTLRPALDDRRLKV